MHPDLSDADLMQAVRAGDEAAFRILVERHQVLVFGTIVKMIGDRFEAEDLAQTAFLRVFQAAKSYEPSAQFKTWLMTIVRNLVINEYRRRSRKATESLDITTDSSSAIGPREIPDSGEATPSQALVRQELAEIIDAAILALPEQQRAAIILSRYQEMSYEEISKVLKVSTSATKSLLFRARDTLKERLRPYLGERP